MKKTAIIYSSKSGKTARIGEKIARAFGEGAIDTIDALDITGEKFMEYDNLILGVPTWFDGELPHYWDEFVPDLEELDLNGKNIAIYGLGDQVHYPQNFVDAIGLMSEIVSDCGARVVGHTSIEGYTFENSHSVVDDKFLGLVIDQENQSALTNSRVVKWVEELKPFFL